MKYAYIEKNFRQQSLYTINKINKIIDEYKRKGYDLTLRQVYYQLVARNIIPNSERSYKNLGNLISDGRMAGLIDWEAIIDRTRNLRGSPHWESPAGIIRACAAQFQYDKWEDQEYYVEVWVEKDALIDVVGRACQNLDISYFSCRGYTSQSEMWSAAQRLSSYNQDEEKKTAIIHLGDHDPSGKDMSRDIVDRLSTFGVHPEFTRIALNMDQVEKYDPPPNPAKVTDSRYSGYIKRYGDECWELDALEPEIIDKLIKDSVGKYCDLSLFEAQKRKERDARYLLEKVSDDWDEIKNTYSE